MPTVSSYPVPPAIQQQPRQYSTIAPGANPVTSGLMLTYGNVMGSEYQAWMPDSWATGGYLFIGQDPEVTTELRSPDIGHGVAIGWKAQALAQS